MIKEILFFVWALIFPILFGIKSFLQKKENSNLTKEIMPVKNSQINAVSPTATLPVFCQDVLLIVPLCGIILGLMCYVLANHRYDNLAEIFDVLCLIQLTILDLVRGLKIDISPFGNIRYNWPFFFIVFILTIIHINSVHSLINTWNISLLSLIFLSISGSISSWKYIEHLYDGVIKN